MKFFFFIEIMDFKHYLRLSLFIDKMKKTKDKEKKLSAEIEELKLRIKDLEKVISDEKEIEKELKISETRFRVLFENSPDAIFVEDLSGNVLDVNPAAAALHGIERERMIGMNVVDLVPPQMRERISFEFKEQEKDEFERIESFSWKSNGSTIPVEISIARIEYSQNPALLLHVRDISERYQTWENLRKYRKILEKDIKSGTNELSEKNILLEKEVIERANIEKTLRESEERYKKLTEFLPMAIVVFREDKLLYANSKAYELAKLKEQDPYEIPVFQFIHPDYHDLIRERYELVISGEDQPETEVKIIDTEGNILDIDLLSCRVSYEGYPAVLAVLNDVTQRNLLERQLIQAQKMEAVGRLAGGIAHDFNNLLTVIKGYSEIILQKIKEDDPLFKGAEQIKISSERAESLTHQLLAFSRRQLLHPNVLNLNELVTNVEKLLKRLLPENIKIKTELLPDLWNIKVDPVQLEQVLMNLSINSGDAMPDGGTLLIKTKNLNIKNIVDNHEYQINAGEYVQLILSDTGLGMDKKTRVKIFEPFFTTKETGKGTGLGLSMVYGFVKQSDGYISAKSIKNKGTSFEILIPRVKEKISIKEKKKDEKQVFKGKEKILLVEDNEAVRNMISEMLKMNDYEVILASDGEEALLKTKRKGRIIDLVITDVIMPKMGGDELAKLLREKFPGIKFLFMSGYSSEVLGDNGKIDMGMNFVQKPFTAKTILGKIREIMDK